MAEEVVVATPAPAAPVTPPATPPATTPAGEPNYLEPRLERERRGVLKQLGFKVDKDIPAQRQLEGVAKDIETLKTDRKTERKAKEKAEAELATANAKLGALKTYADMELAALPAEMQTKIKAVAGDDPAEQLKTIALLKGMTPPAPEKVTPPGETPPPQKDAPPPPAGTAPPAGPPPQATGDALPLIDQWKQINQIAPAQDGTVTRREVTKALWLLEHGATLIDHAFKRL